MRSILWIAGVLAVLWAVLWFGLKIAGFAVHLLLAAAVLLVIWGALKKAF